MINQHLSPYNLLPFFFMAFAMPLSATLIYCTALLNYLQCFISEAILFLAVSLLVVLHLKGQFHHLFQSYSSKTRSAVQKQEISFKYLEKKKLLQITENKFQSQFSPTGLRKVKLESIHLLSGKLFLRVRQDNIQIPGKLIFSESS